MLQYSNRKNLIYILSVSIFKTIIYYINGNKYGLLILFVCFYFFSPRMGLEKPYNFYELIIWIDQLPGDRIISIGTSLLTIIGFLIAFQISTQSARNEMWMNLSKDASEKINNLTHFAFDSAQKFEWFSAKAIEIYENIGEKPDEEIIFEIGFLIDNYNDLYKRKAGIKNLTRSLMLIKDQILYIIADSWTLENSVLKLHGAFHKFYLSVLKLHFPSLEKNSPNLIPLYKQFLPKETYIKLNKEFSISQYNIIVFTSDVRRNLLLRYGKFNLKLVYNTMKNLVFLDREKRKENQ